MNQKHLIFDIDGTILDTEKPLIKTTQKVLQTYGYNIDYQTLQTILGIPIEISFKQINVQVDENYMNLWTAEYAKHSREAKYFQGIEKVLQTLKEKNINLGIISSRTQEEYDKFLKPYKLETYFNTIILIDHIQNPKPHPEPIEKYINQTKAKRENCIYIGDRPTDIQCAKNAKIKSALALWSKASTKVQGADFLLYNPKDILEII